MTEASERRTGLGDRGGHLRMQHPLAWPGRLASPVDEAGVQPPCPAVTRGGGSGKGVAPDDTSPRGGHTARSGVAQGLGRINASSGSHQDENEALGPRTRLC